MGHKSVMQHSFANLPSVNAPRSTFKRPWRHTTTLDASWLVPMEVVEIYPGDTVNLKTSLFCRMSTPVKPIMDNLYLEHFWFFVPNRLLWSNWQRFMGERDPDPDSSIDFTIPQCEINTSIVFQHSLHDYFGLPETLQTGDGSVSALPFRAYNKIFNDWFRDQNLMDSVTVNLGDGPDMHTLYELRKRCKRPDYFTTCMPTPQKGSAISVPIGTSAPVFGNGYTIGIEDGSPGGVTGYGGFGYSSADGKYGGNVGYGALKGTGYAAATLSTGAVGVVSKAHAGAHPEYSGLYADLTGATAATINDLREAFQLQKMLERDMRGGTRYIELLRSHFGVISPDARLQRAEYLGGGSCRIAFNPVQQTSESTATSKQGNLSAYALGADTGHIVKSFVEHGIMMLIVNVRSDLTYQQGIDRYWSRLTRYDFYWPALAMLGEQEVLNKEIYYNNDANDDLVFGYQERWAELRYMRSKVTGQMRSTHATPLDYWHLAEEFGSLPVLSDAFIEDSTDVTIDSRITAVNTEPQFFLDAYYSLMHTRAMPVYSIPGLIDHF